MHKPQKLDALTSLRFFAAAMIVLAHSKYTFSSMNLAGLFQLSQGVSFFFVLSGFILAYNYPVLASWAEVGAFFKARFARIWPAHLAAIGLLLMLTGDMGVSQISSDAAIFVGFANIFLFQSIIPLRDVFFAFNPVAWSISTEMFFYLAFPLLITNIWLNWRTKLLFIVTLVTLYLWFIIVWKIPSDELVRSVSQVGLVVVNPLVRLLEFFIGVLTGVLFIYSRPRVNYSSVHFTCAEIAVVTLALLSMFISEYQRAIVWSDGFERVMSGYVAMAGSFWIFAFLIFTFAFGKGSLSNILSKKPMILLGEISFALYLVHKTVLHWYELNSAYFQNIPEWLAVVSYWVLSLTIAYLLHKLVENPCRRLILNFSKAKALEMLKGFVLNRVQAAHLVLAVGVVGTMIIVPLYGPQLVKSDTCPASTCKDLVDNHRLTTSAVFGDYVELSSLKLSNSKETKPEYSQLDFLFNVHEPLPAGYRMAIHLVDADGLIISQLDSLLVKNRNLPRGEQWLESIDIPTRWLTQGKGIGVAIYSDPQAPLFVTYPSTDFDGHRVLFKFSQIYS